MLRKALRSVINLKEITYSMAPYIDHHIPCFLTCCWVTILNFTSQTWNKHSCTVLHGVFVTKHCCPTSVNHRGTILPQWFAGVFWTWYLHLPLDCKYIQYRRIVTVYNCECGWNTTKLHPVYYIEMLTGS
jgi:hypothetical protein